jgi:hypothetical protein
VIAPPFLPASGGGNGDKPILPELLETLRSALMPST